MVHLPETCCAGVYGGDEGLPPPHLRPNIRIVTSAGLDEQDEAFLDELTRLFR